MRRPTEDEVGSFLTRWSRRKAAARRGTPEPEPPAPATGEEVVEKRRAEPTGETGGPAGPGPRREEPGIGIDLAKLPDPDTLDAASDFSVFMQPGVPAELRRRALRRLWKVNPIISTPDGLDDYYVVNDFSDASTVVANLKTLYRVGRGMVSALEEEEEERAAAAAGAGPGAPTSGEPVADGTGEGVQAPLEERKGEVVASLPPAAAGGSAATETVARSTGPDAGERPLAADPERS